MEEHLGYPKNGKASGKNNRNGYKSKTVKSSLGSFELSTPRDRENTFEPQIIQKRQTYLPEDLEAKIISLYGSGMSSRNIIRHFQEMYGVELSRNMITTITDKIISEIEEWRNRPLDAVYPIMFMDAVHFKVKEDNKVVKKAVYAVIGITMEGKKAILGIYINESEGAKFWLGVLTELSNRGVKDVLIACIDNLKGFSQAIESIFPETEVQLCVIHQIRNSLKYVSWKDYKAFLKDLKTVYQADTKEIAESQLIKLEESWGKKYPIVIKSWYNNWERLSNYFKYPKDIRKIIYTTNLIEGFNRQLRKVTKTKGAFPSETALIKVLYLTIQNITAKWTMPYSNWGQILSQLSIFFEERLALEIAL
jgi:putative transposase